MISRTDSAVGTNQSSVSGSEVSSLSKSVETPDVSNLVAPKRGAKKTQAPLPPGTEATVQVAKVTTASVVTKAPATSGNQDVPTTNQKVAVTTTRATVTVATEETSGDSDDKNKTTRVAVTTTQAKATITPEEMEPLRKSPAPERSNPVTTETGVEKTQPVAKRSTKFAANQALISNVLSGPRKTLLSRPNTVYMENAKVELVKTAEEQYRDETTRSEMNGGAGNSLGKTVEEDGVPEASLPAVQPKKKPPSVAEESSSQKKSAKKAEPSVSEMYAAADEIGILDSDEEIRSPSPQGQRRSGGRDTPEDQLPKKPERPSKPVRPTQGGDTAEGGNRSSGGYKVSTEDHFGKKEASIVESSSTAKPHGESTGGTQSSSLGKQPKQPPPEVPQVVPQQPASGGSGVRPPKPPPPRLTSDSAIEEDTYL